MKRCPRCSIEYSEMWNLCDVCRTPLGRQTPLKKSFFGPTPKPNISPAIIERIVDRADALFLYLDKDLRPIMCNKAIENITGYSREEIFKGDWLQLLFRNYPTRKEIFKAVIAISSLQGLKSQSYEGAIAKKDGSECILSWRNIAVTDIGGNTTGIICTAQDITEKKSLEDNAALQYERSRNIFASIKDYALITTNLEGKITYYGTSSVELFGWKEDMTLRDIYIIFSESDRYRLKEKIKESIAGYGKFEGEVSLLRDSKESFPAVLTVTCLLDNKSEKIGYIFIARDMTERKKLEMELVQSEKLAAIGQLASGVAHEINNPLLVIIGRLEMLSAEDININPEVKRTVEIVRNQAARMRTIVDRLLLYSRKKTPQMDMVDINEILKTISPLLAYYPEFKNIIWKEELAEGLPKVKGDFNQLQEVFVNIGLNACQAMQKGGVITMRSENKNGDFTEVIFKDTGVGIKKEHLGKLFTPFFTTKDRGAGLGLAICQTIIKSHGGSIEVESEEGKGTIFKIKLPVKIGV